MHLSIKIVHPYYFLIQNDIIFFNLEQLKLMFLLITSNYVVFNDMTFKILYTHKNKMYILGIQMQLKCK